MNGSTTNEMTRAKGYCECVECGSLHTPGAQLTGPEPPQGEIDGFNRLPWGGQVAAAPSVPIESDALTKLLSIPDDEIVQIAYGTAGDAVGFEITGAELKGMAGSGSVSGEMMGERGTYECGHSRNDSANCWCQSIQRAPYVHDPEICGCESDWEYCPFLTSAPATPENDPYKRAQAFHDTTGQMGLYEMMVGFHESEQASQMSAGGDVHQSPQEFLGTRCAVELTSSVNIGDLHYWMAQYAQSETARLTAGRDRLLGELKEYEEMVGQMNRDIDLIDAGRIYAMPQGWLLPDGRCFDTAIEAYRAILAQHPVESEGVDTGDEKCQT